MFDFLFVNEAEVYINTSQKKEIFISEFFEQIKAELPKAYVQNKDIFQSNNELSFTAPPFRYVWNGWNIFNPITKAEFKFSQVSNLLQLNTRMCFKEFFLVALALSFASIPGFIIGAYAYSIAWLIGLWLLFYGGSRLINNIRMEGFIKRIISKTEKHKTPPRTLEDVWKEDKEFINAVFVPAFLEDDK